jgi:eukaryotic-like serine/threonine-protein kinase
VIPSDHDRDAAEVFSDALELPAEERDLFLQRACAGDAALRAEVESLLAAHPAASALLREPLSRADLPDDAEREIGRQFGAYRITAFLASGGMGAVYLGERVDQEFRRTVAIKLIRAGMETREILSRYRNERQILADLEHPNIARLLDGGSTPEGLPYLVM